MVQEQVLIVIDWTLYNFPYNPDGTFGSGSGSTNLSHPLVAYTNSNSSGGENVIGVHYSIMVQQYFHL